MLSCNCIKGSAELCATGRPGYVSHNLWMETREFGRVVDLSFGLLLLLLLSSIRRPLGPWRRVRPQWTGQTGSEGLQQIEKISSPKYSLKYLLIGGGIKMIKGGQLVKQIIGGLWQTWLCINDNYVEHFRMTDGPAGKTKLIDEKKSLWVDGRDVGQDCEHWENCLPEEM